MGITQRGVIIDDWTIPDEVAAAHRAEQLAGSDHYRAWDDVRPMTTEELKAECDRLAQKMREVVLDCDELKQMLGEAYPQYATQQDSAPRQRGDRVLLYPLLAVIFLGGVIRGVMPRS